MIEEILHKNPERTRVFIEASSAEGCGDGQQTESHRFRSPKEEGATTFRHRADLLARPPCQHPPGIIDAGIIGRLISSCLAVTYLGYLVSPICLERSMPSCAASQGFQVER